MTILDNKNKTIAQQAGPLVLKADQMRNGRIDNLSVFLSNPYMGSLTEIVIEFKTEYSCDAGDYFAVDLPDSLNTKQS